jgi:hypothetical protein
MSTEMIQDRVAEVRRMSIEANTHGGFPHHPADLLARDERDDVVIRQAHTQMARKKAAEGLCAAINGALGWRGADPEWTLRGYTGGVVLSQRAAVELMALPLLVGGGDVCVLLSGGCDLA